MFTPPTRPLATGTVLLGLTAGLAALLSASPLAGQGGSQQQAPTFRAGVQTVAIYATVLDRGGRLVPDLEENDFEVLDNGKAQPITLFKSDIQPITVVVALDTSGSMTLNLDRLKLAAEAFVLRLLPDDKARIFGFDDKIIMSGEFTHDRDELVRFLHEDMQYGNGTRLWDAVSAGMDAMQEEQGRRVVLAFTDGEDTTSRMGNGTVMKRAQTDEYMVYAIGFRSTYRGGPGGSMITTRPDSGLKKLAEETGGGYFELSRAADLNATFTRVADELHRQYVIGFSPAVLDGKLHQLQVRIKQPGMTARARKSYMATKQTP
jgi:VWFA-related protein